MMYRLWRVGVILTPAIALHACDLGPLEDGERLRLLNEAEARWSGSGIRSYNVQYTVSCFCRYRGAIDLTVVNGVIVRAHVRSESADAPPDNFKAIDSLFAFVRRELRDDPTHLRVTFDRVLGYPREIDWRTPENDAGGYIGADSLVPVMIR